MSRASIKLFTVLICLMQYACVKQVNVPIKEGAQELVVEGLISTDSVPYLINLSYSGPYTNTSQANADTTNYFIPNAKVTILDNLGDSTSCAWIGLGTYQSTDSSFVGIIGRSYTLKVYLPNGKIYVSKPETITPVPVIDSLTVGYDSTQTTGIVPPPLIVTVNTHDPGGAPYYYRWTASGYVPRRSWGMPCRLGDPPCTDPYVCVCAALCEQSNSDNQLSIYSNQFTQGREIIQPVYYSPVYWFGEHFVQINQYSLSLDAYQFWMQYLAQTNRTGSILDPLPAPLTGNIYNQADSNDVALGLFSATAVYVKKVIIVPFFLQQYELQSVAGQYIEMGDCEYAYPNTLPDGSGPPGWQNAQVINLY